MTDLVGVVGASGDVGGFVLRELAAARDGAGPRWAIRSGARHPDRLAGRAEAADVDAREHEPIRVNVDDPESLAAFVSGCRIVINAAGPSHRIGGKVAAAAAEVGADYVDVAGERSLAAELAVLDNSSGWRAVIGAGLTPGLTGVLPRLLLNGFPPGARLLGCSGGADRFSPAGAADYLAALGADSDGNRGRRAEGEAGAAWLGGRRVSHAVTTVDGAILAHLPRLVTLVPYLGAEAERLAVVGCLDEVRWYSLFDGDAVLRVLRSGIEGGPDVRAADLVAAARLDLLGKSPYQLVLAQAEGTCRGEVVRRGLLLQGRGAAELSAVFAVAVCDQLVTGRIPVGRWFAAQVVDPELIWRRLISSPAVVLHSRSDAVDLFDPTREEGAL